MIEPNARSAGVKVLSVVAEHPSVKVDATQLPKVVLSLDLAQPGESIVNTQIVIHTDDPTERTIPVPVFVRK
ncbi:MAG: hypothetical protein ACRCZF_08155, partial [Gemmataceae bacterium]